MELALTARSLNWPDCRNARDLGGLPRQGGVTRAGVLVRSDSVVHLTHAGRRAVDDYGVTTVIDLRSLSEVLGSPNPFADGLGPKYLHVPLVDDATMLRLGEVSTMFERYLMILDQRHDAFRDIFDAVAESDGGVVFHCFAGKDRTGLVAALLLSVAGVPEEGIASDFAATDAQLATRYEEWIAASAPDRRAEMRDELQCPPERILGALDHVRRRWGGVPAYLEAAGVAPEAIDRLSAKLA